MSIAARSSDWRDLDRGRPPLIASTSSWASRVDAVPPGARSPAPSIASSTMLIGAELSGESLRKKRASA